MRAPIHSRKHYVQTSLATVLSGQTNAILTIDAVPVSAKDAPNEIEEGAVVKAVFVEMWVRAGDISAGSTLVTIVKTVEDSVPTFADMIALDTYNNKKNILYHTQGLTNDQNANGVPFVRQWFKIPKSKQRFGLGDRLYVVVTAQALDNIICGFSTYKEYT